MLLRLTDIVWFVLWTYKLIDFIENPGERKENKHFPNHDLTSLCSMQTHLIKLNFVARDLCCTAASVLIIDRRDSRSYVYTKYGIFEGKIEFKM